MRAGRLPGIEVEGKRGLVIPGAGPGLGGVVQAQRAAGTGSCLAVPLISGGKVTGVLTVTWPEPRLLSPAQQQLLAAVAGYAAQALTWARQFEAEHAVAHQLQQAMIGPVGNADGRVEVDAVYRPATTDLEVGGDWYDVLTVTDDCMALIVGDVVGHGISAASAMGQLRSALRGLVLAGLPPAAALEALDRFASAVPEAQFSSCLVAFLDAEHIPISIVVSPSAVLSRTIRLAGISARIPILPDIETASAQVANIETEAGP